MQLQTNLTALEERYNKMHARAKRKARAYLPADFQSYIHRYELLRDANNWTEEEMTQRISEALDLISENMKQPKTGMRRPLRMKGQ